MKLNELINLFVNDDIYLDLFDPESCICLYEGPLDELPYKFIGLPVLTLQATPNKFDKNIFTIGIDCKNININEYIYA